MKQDNGKTEPRVYLVRLIPDAIPNKLQSEKQANKVRRQQTETIAKSFLSKFQKVQTAIICEDAEQCVSLCPQIYQQGDNRKLSQFFDGTINQLALCSVPNTPFKVNRQTFVFFLTSNTTDLEITENIKHLLLNPNVTVFMLYHINTPGEWNISRAVENFDPTILSRFNITVEDNSTPEKPEDENDFDRVKSYTLPYNDVDAIYKFMWNDGYNGVYYLILQNGKTINEGYRYDTTLLKLLNKEFDQQIPSVALSNCIAEAFNDQNEYEKV